MTGLRDMARRLASRGSGGRRVLDAALAAAIALFAALAVSAGAGTSSSTVVVAGGPPPAARLIHQPGATLSSARLARSAISWVGGPTVATTGETVNVYVSSALTPDIGSPQYWADFLVGMIHGHEIAALTVYIATFAEMQEICGEDALGCYSVNRMVSMAETMFGVTAAEVVRHEYGHHIAFHRLNPPWHAIDWGPKTWASANNICRRAGDGSAYPGDEGDSYSLNPGEAWAETYRLLDEQRAGVTSSGWEIIDSSFYPNEAAFLAAERDVLQPWSSPTATVLRNRFRKQGKRVWAIPLVTPLDGSIEIMVRLPRNGLHDLVLLKADRRTVLAEGLWASANTKKITSTVCGDRSLVLRVTQKGAFGQVKVATRVP